MSIKRTLGGIATTMSAAGILAAGAATTTNGVHHDMVNQASSGKAVAAETVSTSGVSSGVHHDM